MALEWKIRSSVGESNNCSMGKWHNVMKQNVREYGLRQWKKGMINNKILV